MSLLDNRMSPWFQETPSGTVDGANTSFTLTTAPKTSATLALFLDGVALKQTTHYTISSTTITMVTAPVVGQELYAIYRKA